MFETFDAVEISHPSTRHFFKAPAILAALSALAFGATVISGGVGPCGGGGLPFLLAFFVLAPATIVAFVISCGRLIVSRHAHR